MPVDAAAVDQLRVCPSCGRTSFLTVFTVRARQFCDANSTYRTDYAEVLGISPDTEYSIVRCSICDFVYARDLPSRAFLDLVYDKVIDSEVGKRESLTPDWVAHQLRLGAILLEQIGLRFGTSSPWRVLDFGCGYGTLLRALATPEVTTLGFETSPSRLEYLAAAGLHATGDLNEVYGLVPFDAVSLSDVLEHVPDPRSLLVTCRELLVPSGLILVNVPEFPSERLETVSRALASGDLVSREVNPWEHLNYFDQRSLRTMIEGCGFRCVRHQTSIDVGLRDGLAGVKKWGNLALSALRLLRSGFGWRPSSTLVLAVRET